VLVHGLWGNPEDWRWVREPLEAHGVVVVTPDLPSHRSIGGGRVDDAEEVRRAVRSSPTPVVLVGWSYGGSVISVAGAGEASVVRLIYVADLPRPVHDGEDAGWMLGDEHLLVGPDGRCVLDNRWWLKEEAGTTFPSEVQEHLRRNPRRPVTPGTSTDPQSAAAYEDVATTVLLGADDDLASPGAISDALRAAVRDIRVMPCDHFILFRHPDVVVATILEALGGAAGP
jgi:pimeloyl-ACP methyl ester carboxylesterase